MEFLNNYYSIDFGSSPNQKNRFVVHQKIQKFCVHPQIRNSITTETPKHTEELSCIPINFLTSPDFSLFRSYSTVVEGVPLSPLLPSARSSASSPLRCRWLKITFTFLYHHFNFLLPTRGASLILGGLWPSCSAFITICQCQWCVHCSCCCRWRIWNFGFLYWRHSIIFARSCISEHILLIVLQTCGMVLDY